MTLVKRERGNNKITSQLVFHAVIYPPCLPQQRKHSVLQTTFTEIYLSLPTKVQVSHYQ